MFRKLVLAAFLCVAMAGGARAAAVDDVYLRQGESCGFHFGNEVLLINRSSSSAIVVTVRKYTVGELGRTYTRYDQVRVEAGEERSVGCTRTGGVGHQISSSTYSVTGARYVQ
jgi:hypothetical protein